MASIDLMIKWMTDREGKVRYSMSNRLGPDSYDCSSAVFNSLMAGDFLVKGTYPGTTENLYALEGSLLLPISKDQVQRGDIFVSGVKGSSLGSGGHTGIFLDNLTIIHCTVGGGKDGVVTTPATGWMGDYSGYPIHYYRLKGSEGNPLSNLETVIPLGGISVGTNVWYQQGKLVAKSDQEPTVGPARGIDSAWIEGYVPGKLAPYLLKKNGQNLGYTTIDYIQRVSLLPANGIREGSNVLCSKYGKSAQEVPITKIDTTSFWVAQYLDGNLKAPYRLLKNGKTVGYTTRENLKVVGEEVTEVAPTVGEISVGTNVWFQEGRLTSSMEKDPSMEPSRGTNSAWVKDYFPKKKAPYLLMKNNVNIGYTTRANIQRVSQIPQNGILEGENVICDKYSKTSNDYPAFLSNNTSYWVAQYIDGGLPSPYRLLKNGKTQGYTTRENLRVV